MVLFFINRIRKLLLDYVSYIFFRVGIFFLIDILVFFLVLKCGRVLVVFVYGLNNSL